MQMRNQDFSSLEVVKDYEVKNVKWTLISDFFSALGNAYPVTGHVNTIF